jgi:hypothetical protein
MSGSVKPVPHDVEAAIEDLLFAPRSAEGRAELARSPVESLFGDSERDAWREALATLGRLVDAHPEGPSRCRDEGRRRKAT